MKPPILTDHGRSKPVTVLGTKHSITSLAEATGYSIGYVSRILRGQRTLRPEACKKLARALKVTPAVLAKRIKEQS